MNPPPRSTDSGACLGQPGCFEEAPLAPRSGVQFSNHSQRPRSGVQAGEAESLYYAGVATHAKGNYAEAVEKFKAALQKRADFPEARHAMGLSLAAQGALDEAI